MSDEVVDCGGVVALVEGAAHCLFMAAVSSLRARVQGKSAYYTNTSSCENQNLIVGLTIGMLFGMWSRMGIAIDYDYIYIVYEWRTCELPKFHSSS